MGKQLLATADIAKSNELTESEVSEMTSTTIDETALAILKRQGSQGIKIVSLQKTFIFDSSILSILIQLTDKTHQSGSKGLPNCQILPMHLELQPSVKMCFG